MVFHVLNLFNTHFIFQNFFFENLAFYEIMWKNYSRAGQATGGMPIA